MKRKTIRDTRRDKIPLVGKALRARMKAKGIKPRRLDGYPESLLDKIADDLRLFDPKEKPRGVRTVGGGAFETNRRRH